MILIPSIDGGFGHLDAEQIVKLVKLCYHRTAKIPSRGVLGYTNNFASAAGALAKGLHTSLNDFLPGFSTDWQTGFVEGFEHTGPNPDLPNSNDWRRGFNVGLKTANIIFSWPDAPDIDSKPMKGYT